jgi:hypothetical protein
MVQLDSAWIAPHLADAGVDFDEHAVAGPLRSGTR